MATNSITASQGRYKAHPCPKCQVVHKGKGPYCSKVCSNSDRDDEYKEKMRQRSLYTDKGQLATWNLNWGEDYEPIIAGGPVGLKDNQFVADGDVWTSE